MVPRQYLSTEPIFNPPSFSPDTTFKCLFHKYNIVHIVDSKILFSYNEVLNVLLNRLGSKLLAENVFYGPIRKILKKKLRSRIGTLFKNYGLVALDVGQTFPIIKKIGIFSGEELMAVISCLKGLGLLLSLVPVAGTI